MLARPVGRPPNEVRRSYANFTYQAGSWTKARRAVAKVEWHRRTISARPLHRDQHGAPGRECRRLLQEARRVRAMDQRGQGRDQMDAAVMPLFRCQRRPALAARPRLQSRQLPAHARDAGADRGMVADKLEGKADQDRRGSRESWALCRLPECRGRNPTQPVHRDFADDRGSATAAGCLDSVGRSGITRSGNNDGRSTS